MTHISNRPEGVAGAVLRPLIHDLIAEYNRTHADDEAELLALMPENKPGDDVLIEVPLSGSKDAVDSRPAPSATRSFPVAG